MPLQRKQAATKPSPILVPARPYLRKHTLFLRWAAVAFAALVLLVAIALSIINKRAGPFARAYVIRLLEARYDAKVDLGRLAIVLYPRLHATGEDLVIRRRSQPSDLPPFISVDKFTVDADLRGVLGDVAHIRKLRLEGFQINVPPRAETRPKATGRSKTELPELIIDEMHADGTVLRIYSRKPGKKPLEFDIERLMLRAVGKGQPMWFQAKLMNPTPPGLIDSQGHFGPWNAQEPSLTPVSGQYTFRNADLSVFRGISGKLSSDGKYEGRLERIEVRGQTETPDFTVGISGNPVHLSTDFNAIVDGTNGDTLLQPVVARFLASTLLASGGIENRPGTKGKTISLNVSASGAKIQDLMRLAVKHTPPLTGLVHMRTRFELPPGKQDLADKLYLDGHFSLEGVRFTDPDVQHKILTLSRRGRGINKNEEKELQDEPIVSDLKGSFQLRNATMSFSQLSFQVPGARVSLRGIYGLRNDSVDFAGDLRMRATISQMTTGMKALLLKPFDPLLSRGRSGTILPIRVTGTGDHPQFGVEKRRLLPWRK